MIMRRPVVNVTPIERLGRVGSTAPAISCTAMMRGMLDMGGK